MRRLRSLVRVAVALVVAAVVFVAARTARAAEPTVVTTGMWVNQIHELNLKENYFVVDLYVWFRWKGELKPNETWTFIDGRIESKTDAVKKTLADGSQYVCQRVVVKVTKFWDVSRYPLDGHVLVLAVEEDEGEEHLVKYVADTENSGIDPKVAMPGWALSIENVTATTGHYKSNFGDTSIPTGKESRYARAVAKLSLQRAGVTYFVKVFFGVWVAAAIAFLCFFIKPTNVDPRFGLGVGAIFAAIASEYTISSSLPEGGIATLADRVHLVAYTAIFVALAQSTASLWLVEHGKEDTSKRFDKLFAWALPLAYAVANALVVARS